MRKNSSPLRIGLVILGVLAAALPAPRAAAQDVVAAARASLPEATRQAGVLNVVMTFQWPPFAYQLDSGDLDGIDVSLMRLLAAKLGLKPQFTDITNIPVILNGVATGRYDVSVGQMGITAERLKVVGFVPYYKSGYALLVKKGKTGIDINHLCGHRLAITQGSSQVVLVDALSAECVAAGKPPIATDVYPNANESQLAIANGRGEGFVTGSASAVYNAKGNPQLEVAPGELKDRASIVGIVVARTNPQLGKALELALESAVADGSYKALFDRFGIQDGALTLDQMRTPPARLAAIN